MEEEWTTGQIKLEYMSDAGRSLTGSRVSQQVKLEQQAKREVKKEDFKKKVVKVSQKFTFAGTSSFPSVQIVVESASKIPKYPPRLQNPKFDCSNLWKKAASPSNCLDQFTADVLGEGDNQENELTELPADHYRMNPPHIYEPPPEPFKKKQYRPPVPTNFKSGFDTFLMRRKRTDPEKDLTVLDVDEVLYVCEVRKVLSQTLVNRHLALNGMLHVKRYLQKWMMGRLGDFDFRRTEFTLLDHRRLSQLLLHLFPKDYTIGTPDALHHDNREFFRKQYALSPDDYVRAYTLQDAISKCTWWRELRRKYKGTEHEHYFRVKEGFQGSDVLLREFDTPQKRSRKLRELLGPLQLQNPEVEIEKILSKKKEDEEEESEQMEMEGGHTTQVSWGEEEYQRGSNTGQFFSSNSPRHNQFSSDIQARSQRLVMGGGQEMEEEYQREDEDDNGVYEGSEEEDQYVGLA